MEHRILRDSKTTEDEPILYPEKSQDRCKDTSLKKLFRDHRVSRLIPLKSCWSSPISFTPNAVWTWFISSLACYIAHVVQDIDG